MHRWEKDIEAAERKLAEVSAEQYPEDMDAAGLMEHLRIVIADLREALQERGKQQPGRARGYGGYRLPPGRRGSTT